MNDEKKGLEFELELFLSVQEHVRKGKFKEALRELRGIQEQLPPQSQSVEKAHLYRWFATIYYYMGDHTVALAHAERANSANQGAHGDMSFLARFDWYSLFAFIALAGLMKR